MLARLVPNQSPSLNFGTSGVFSEIVRLSLNYQHRQSFGCIVGLDRVPFGGSEVKAAFSYSFPLPTNNQGNIQTIEITLGYLLVGKRNKEQENHIIQENDENSH